MFQNTAAMIEWLDERAKYYDRISSPSWAQRSREISAELTRLQTECDARREGAWEACMKLIDVDARVPNEFGYESRGVIRQTYAQIAALKGGDRDGRLLGEHPHPSHERASR